MATRTRGDMDDSDTTDLGNELWDNHGDCHTVTARERIRQQLASDIEAYIAHGGKIQHLEPHMRAENTGEDVSGSGLKS